MKTMPADVAAVCEAMRASGAAALAVHQKPDLDCLGAAVAMVDLLGQLGREAHLHLDPAEQLPPSEFFLDHASVVRALPPTGVQLIVVDTGAFPRMALALESWDGQVVNIDHHHDNTRYGNVALVRGEASSTCEIVCGLAQMLDLAPGPQAATALYAGISFDSGHFRHGSTSAETFAAAGWLVELGVDPTAVFAEMYERRSLASLRLWGRAVDKVTSVANGRALISTLTCADYEATGAGENETEAVVDSLRAVDGVEVAALVKEQSTGSRVRVSLRSEGLDVSAVAALRSGGGHKMAAGFSADEDPEEVTRWLSSVLAERLATA